MEDDLLTTIRFEVDAAGVSNGLTSVKRSIEQLGKSSRQITESLDKDLQKLGKNVSLDDGAKKATKALYREMADLAKQITLVGTTAQQEFKNIGKSADAAYVNLAGKGVPTEAIEAYTKLLKEAQSIAQQQAQTAAKAAAEQASATQKLMAEEDHYAELKKQHAAYNKTLADQRAKELREELALIESINDATLRMKTTGKAGTLPPTYYEAKAGAKPSSNVSDALSAMKDEESQIKAAAQQQMKILALNNQIQASNKATAEARSQEAARTAAALKEQTAALAAFKTEIQNAELNLTHFGRAKTAAFLQDKGARLGFDPAMVQAELAGLQKIEAANKAAFAAANPHIAELTKRAEVAGTSVKGLTANLRNVPVQLTDIVISLQGGQAPLTVLLQQGGQLKDMFGGIGNAARALGGYVASLINPFSLAAAAVGTLGYAYFAGSKELDEYRKALILTGNAVGLTGGQMADMARSMAAVGGTQTAAANALVAFVNAGAAGSESLQKFAQSAINFEKVTGQAVEETAKQFTELGKNPLEASVKLNESTNFLTMSLYEQIKALEEQGKKTEAANVAQQAYSDTLNQNTAQITANLGTIEKAWNAIASATKGAWDWMKNIGRDDGPTQKLAKLQIDVVNAENNLKSAIASSFGGAVSGKAQAYKKELQEAQDKLAEFNKTTSLAQIRATDRGIESQAVKNKIEWDKTHQSQLDKLQQSLHKEVEDYAKLKAAGKDDAQTRLQYEQRIHHLVKQEADYLKGEYKTELQKPKSGKVDGFGKELSATKEWLATQERMLKDSYSTQQKDLEDSFKSQEITAAQYYASQLASDAESLQQREQVRAEAQARFDAEMAKRVAVTQARPESKAKSTALADLKNEAKNFADAQEAARQKDINSMEKHSGTMAREIDKESQKVTGSVDAYIADMQRKSEADAKLMAAREAMAGQAPEIIAGMEAELKVRADAAKILDQTAESYALAAKNAREYESELQAQYDSGKEVTTAQISMLEDLKAASVDATLALMKLGGAVDTGAIDAGSRAFSASIKAQTDAVTKEIQKSLVDGIMSAGKDGGSGLRKALEDALITRPFRMAIEAYFLPISNSIYQGAAGQTLGASAAGATGLQSTLNYASLAVSNFGSTLIGTAANVATGGATLAQTWAAGSAMMNTAGGTMTGIAMKIGAAAPSIAAAAVAAKSLSNAIDRANGSVTAAGIFAYGRNSPDGFKTGGRADFIQDGGGGTTLNSSWFDPGEATSKYMSAMGELVTKSVKGWAESIGLSSEAVNGYTETVQAAIGNGMSKAEERQSIDKAMAGYGDAMVQALFGQIMAFAKSGETPSGTLERLGNDVTAVNNILRDNGKALYDTSFESAKAVQVLINSVGGLDKFTELAGSLEAVNVVMTKLGQSTFEISMDGAQAANALAKSVGGTAKLSELADGLIHVNENLAKLGEPLLDISVASARTAHTMLTATDNAVKALEAAEKLEASYASFAKNLSKDPDTTQVASLQAIFDRAMANVTKFIPSIKGQSDLTSVTYDQYTSFTDPQRTKLDAAASAFKDLQNAINSAAKSAESAAKTAKDAADAAVKAYSDAIKAIEKDTRNVNREIADFGKTDFQKKLAKIGYDSQDKLAELDELSSKAAELSTIATNASLTATDATLSAVSTMTDSLITASKDLSADSGEVAANIKDTLANSTNALGDALQLVPAIAALFDEIQKGLQKIPPALQGVSLSVANAGDAAAGAANGLSSFSMVAADSGKAAANAAGPILAAGAAFNIVAPGAAAAGAALSTLGAAFGAAAAALTGLTSTFNAGSSAVSNLDAAFAAAATSLGGLTTTLSSAANAGASLAGSLGSVGGALLDIAGAAGNAAGSISSAASALSNVSVSAPSAPVKVVAAASGGAIHGPGTATSDSVPAMLSDGEYVIKASSVDKYGTRFLDSLNAGTLKSTIYRTLGGPVDDNSIAQRMLLGLQTFEGTINSLGGMFSVLRDSADKIKSIATTSTEAYTNAVTTLGDVGYDVKGLDAAGVKSLILGVLNANKPTVNQKTGLLEFSAAQIKVLEPLANALGSVETVLRSLDERQPWQDKLDVLTGKSTERQQALQRDLESTTDSTTQSLIRQVYAQEDLNKAAKATAEFSSKIAEIRGDDAGAAYAQRTADLVGVTDAVTIAEYDLTKAREKEVEWLTTVTDKLKSLTDTFDSQGVDLNRAMGNDLTANALQKGIDLADVRKAAAQAQAQIDAPGFSSLNDADKAALLGTVNTAKLAETQYDLNEARKQEIELLTNSKSRLKSLVDAGKSKEAERNRLLNGAKDNSQEALDLADVYKSTADATELLKTKGLEPLDRAALLTTITTNDLTIAQYKRNAALDEEIEILQRYQSVKDDLDSANIELLKAQGQTATAFGIELAKVTKGFTDAQIATYRQTQATQGLIAAYGNLSSTADMVTTSKIGLLTAQGDTAGAAELQRAFDIKPYTTAIATATEQLSTATTQGEKGILNLTISTNNQAIKNYDLAKSYDVQAESATTAKQAADELAGRYKSLADDLQSAKIALMRASGKGAEADQLEFDAATEGFDALHKSMYREIRSTRDLTTAREKLNSLTSDGARLEIELMRARGNNAQAREMQTQTDLAQPRLDIASAQAAISNAGKIFGEFLQQKTGQSVGTVWNIDLASATPEDMQTMLGNGASPVALASLINNANQDKPQMESTLVDLLKTFAGYTKSDAEIALMRESIITNQGIIKAYTENNATQVQIDIAKEATGLADQLDELTLSAAQLAQKQRALVDPSNRELFDRLQSAKAQKTIDGLRDEAMRNYLDTQNAVKDAQKEYADVLKSTIETMQDFISTLDGGASPLQNLSTARANFQAVAGKAASGDTSAYKDLTPAARAFLDLSKNYSKSIQDYQRDEARVRATLNAVIKVNQSELDKLPKEIAEAADPTKQAWVKLQEAINKQATSAIMLDALQVDQEASKKRLRTAEETLSERYLDAVALLDETKRTSLIDTFDKAVKGKVDESKLPDYGKTFDLAKIWGTKIAGVLPETPLSNTDLNRIIAENFEGLKPSDLVTKLTFEALSNLVSGKMPEQLLKTDLISTTADVSNIVNTKISEILPSDFAGAKFNAAAMMQTAIDKMMASATPALPPATTPPIQTPVVAPDLTTSTVNKVFEQASSVGASGTSLPAWGTLTREEKARAMGVSESSLNSLSYLADIAKTQQQDGVGNTAVALRLKDYLHYMQVPGFAVGTNNVPQDMLAQIHKGEVIIPEPFNPERYNKASGNDALVAEIKALRAEVESLRKSNEASQNAIAANTRKTAQTLTKFDIDGLPEART